MPVILPEEYYDAWLSGKAGKEILKPFPADKMEARPISPRVNNAKNDDEGILEPVVADIQAPRLSPS
jgi:putative SOS response-associated peptidase YedK